MKVNAFNFPQQNPQTFKIGLEVKASKAVMPETLISKLKTVYGSFGSNNRQVVADISGWFVPTRLKNPGEEIERPYCLVRVKDSMDGRRSSASYRVHEPFDFLFNYIKYIV